MAKCVTEDFTLKIPSDWADRSMITWVAPNDGRRKVLPNILCSKDVMKNGEDLDTFVNRQLKELMTKVKNFKLVKRENALFGGKPAVVLQFCMKPQETMLKQHQVFFVANPKSTTVNTVVATSAEGDFAEFEATFNSILGSVSWNS